MRVDSPDLGHRTDRDTLPTEINTFATGASSATDVAQFQPDLSTTTDTLRSEIALHLQGEEFDAAESKLVLLSRLTPREREKWEISYARGYDNSCLKNPLLNN